MSTATATFATTSSTPHLRLTLRGRRVITALIAIPLVILALFTILNGGTATATSTSSAPLEYVAVESGQTLWQLAESISPESDPRDVISDILSFNQLESSILSPGQQLAVPTKYSN